MGSPSGGRWSLASKNPNTKICIVQNLSRLLLWYLYPALWLWRALYYRLGAPIAQPFSWTCRRSQNQKLSAVATHAYSFTVSYKWRLCAQITVDALGLVFIVYSLFWLCLLAEVIRGTFFTMLLCQTWDGSKVPRRLETSLIIKYDWPPKNQWFLYIPMS